MLRLNDNKMKVKQQKGLTLIEIMIVVALLLLIMLAIFKVFNIDINRGKDAQRKTDLRDIKLAFEDYYNDKNAYPADGALNDCGGTSLRPYLKYIPCDPTTGEPYLYLPIFNGYRVLSILEDPSDPIVEEIGCQNGCGLPDNHPKHSTSWMYVYGISEGTPLVLEGATFPTKPPSGGSTSSPTPTPLPSDYCYRNMCYCCANSAAASGQDCNVWVPGNNCDNGPYESTSECYAKTDCKP